jgi:hypothetical protein
VNTGGQVWERIHTKANEEDNTHTHQESIGFLYCQYSHNTSKKCSGWAGKHLKKKCWYGDIAGE